MNALIGYAASEALGDDIEVLGAVRECATAINSFLDGTDCRESILSEILNPDFPVQARFAEIIYRVLAAVGTPFSKREELRLAMNNDILA